MPNKQSLRVGRVFVDTWNFLRFFIVPIATYFLFFVITYFVLSWVIFRFSPNLLGSVLNFLLNMVLYAGFIFFISSLAKDGDSGISLIISSIKHATIRLPNYLLAYVMTAFCFLLGLSLFILPGLYIYARLLLYDFFVLLEKTSSLDALKSSFRITPPVVWTFAVVIVLYFGFLLLVIAGLANVIGHIESSYVAYVYAYCFWIFNVFFTLFRYRYFLLLKAIPANGEN